LIYTTYTHTYVDLCKSRQKSTRLHVKWTHIVGGRPQTQNKIRSYVFVVQGWW